MPELVLSLRERELGRFPIVGVRTTIGRDPGCDVVIDNVGVSRLHATIEVVGDSFVLLDCDSQNGITLNGEPCSEGRVVDGDMIGLNKFLLRFTNQELDVPANLQRESQKPRATAPKEVQRTMEIGADAVQAFAERAKQQIARQRAEIAARGNESLPPLDEPERPSRQSLRWEEPAGAGLSLPVVLGGVLLGGMLLAGFLWIVL